MKQFSLKEYLKNPMKVITRDGRNARIVCVDAQGDYPVVALITEVEGEYKHESPEMYTEDGLYYYGRQNSIDLFFAPEKEETEKQEEDSLDKPKAERFDVNTFQPFDKILVKDAAIGVEWEGSFFCYRDLHYCNGIVCINGQMRYMAIPYNEETKHLLGTTKDCPEYYKWWEN